jgi:hypothetical protein
MKIVRHKLSLSTEYVSTWTVLDALREVFQNAIDHGNWHWLYKDQILTITSKSVALDKKTLLLGQTTKKDDSSKIGQYGEGFKLAMLVLCRLGHKPYILTGTESWEPKLINSRTYGTQQLVFDVHNEQPKVDDIVFVVPDITNEIFNELMDKNLHVREPSTGWQTKFGHILPEDYHGKVFIGGLYVCDVQGMRHGYDLKPSYINLDRDRRIVRDFDLHWLTCQMWKETDEFDYILTLIKEDAPDVKYLDSFSYNCREGLADKAAEAFLDEHGAEAVPVVDQYDINQAKEQGHENIILVPKVTVQLLGQSSIWSRPAPKTVKKRPREILMDFHTTYYDEHFTREMNEDFKEILEKAEDWIC